MEDRIDRLEQAERDLGRVEAERDALAAHLVQNTLLMNRFFLCEDYSNNGEGEGASDGVLVPADLVGAFADLSATTPNASLTRLKAEWQAEALERAIRVMRQPFTEGGHPWLCHVEDLQAMADDYRRQAEEGES